MRGLPSITPRPDDAPVSRERVPDGLGKRGRRVAYALGEALFCDRSAEGGLLPPPKEALQGAVDGFSLALGHAGKNLRLTFGLLSFALEWLPVFVIGRLRPTSSLSLASRLDFVQRLEDHPVGLFTMMLVGFKIPLGLHFFEQQPLLAETGFDRLTTATRRRLVMASAPNATENL